MIQIVDELAKIVLDATKACRVEMRPILYED